VKEDGRGPSIWDTFTQRNAGFPQSQPIYVCVCIACTSQKIAIYIYISVHREIFRAVETILCYISKLVHGT